MNVATNTESVLGSIRKTVAAIPVNKNHIQGNGGKQSSFQGTLEALVGHGTHLVENSTAENDPNLEVIHEGSPTESIDKLLSELETFMKEELDLIEIEDVLSTLPPELIHDIKAFIVSIQSGEIRLELKHVTEKAELIGLLMVSKHYAQDESFTQKDGLMNLVKQLKIIAEEIAPQNLLSGKETTDLKSNKLIHDLIQNIYDSLSKTDKPMKESQTRFQFLQTVHARYFSAPKGIETSPTILVDKLVQKGNSNTTQVQGTVSESIPMNEVNSAPLSKVQQFTLFVEQTGKQQQLPNQQQFIRQFQNILARSSFLTSGGQQKLLINLYPEHLGSLRIELLQSEAGMIARIMASTSQAKELVESQLTNLKQTFLAQNISVEKIEVSTQLQYQAEKNLQRESEQQRDQHSGRQQKQQNEQEPSEEQSFTAALLDELVNFKV